MTHGCGVLVGFRHTNRRGRLILINVFLCLQLALPFSMGWCQQIERDGNTVTSVKVTGSVTEVETSTIRNENAFNSFSRFDVYSGNTVNLHLPDGTSNLINLVHSKQSNIDGILNSYKGGVIGGNVYFANPYGLVVGATGVVNVGSLTVLTPSQEFMDSFFESAGNPSDVAVQNLLSGNVSLTETGLVSVEGKIQAIKEVNLAAGNVSIGNSGRILVQSPGAPETAVDFGTIVNVNSITTGEDLVLRDGTIEIAALENVDVSGVLSSGGTGVEAGDILIVAGQGITVNEGAVLSTRSIRKRDQNLSMFDSAASLADSGDLTLRGSQIAVKDDASILTFANNGHASGDILIDARQTLEDEEEGESEATTDFELPFFGEEEETQSEATIEMGEALIKGGTIDILATASTTLQGTAGATAEISLDGTTIQGEDVTLRADAQSSASFEDGMDASFGHVNQWGLEFLPLWGAFADAESTAKVTVQGTSNVDASGTLDMSTYAKAEGKIEMEESVANLVWSETDATATTLIDTGTVLTVGGDCTLSAEAENVNSVTTTAFSLPTWGGLEAQLVVAGADATSNASATVAQDAVVNVGGQLDLSSKVVKDMSVTASGGKASDDNSVAATIALSFCDSDSTAKLDGDVTAQGGISVSASIEANGNFVEASADAAAAEEEEEEDEEEGTETEMLTSDTDSEDFEASLLEQLAELMPSLDEEAEGGDEEEGGEEEEEEGGEDKGTKVMISAALQYTEHDNNAQASIGSNANVQSGADVSVSSTVKDVAQTRVIVVSEEEKEDEEEGGEGEDPPESLGGVLNEGSGEETGGESEDKEDEGKSVNMTGAASVTRMNNTSYASIDSGAVVDASGLLSVSAKTELPRSIRADDEMHETVIDWLDWLRDTGGNFDLEQFVDDVSQMAQEDEATSESTNLPSTSIRRIYDDPIGVISDYSTSWVQSSSRGATTGISGAVNIYDVTSDTQAWIGENALVNQDSSLWSEDQDVEVKAETIMGAAHASGIISGLNPLGMDAETLAAGGSYLDVSYTSNTVAQIRDGARVHANDLTVSADVKQGLVAVAQSGGESEKYAVQGSVALVDITDTTLAQIDEGALVHVDNDTTVKASDELLDVTVAGSVAAGKNVGVGLSVGINDIERNTSAVVGNHESDAVSLGELQTGGTLAVTAENEAKIISVSLAGTKTSEKKEEKEESGGAGADNEAGTGDKKAEEGGKWGVAVSGDASVTRMDDTAEASIRDANVSANSVQLTADRQDWVLGIAGAAALSTNETSYGVAGSYGQNTITGASRAVVDGSKLDVEEGATLNASTGGGILAITAGGAGSSSTAAVAGSVAINTIDSHTEALVQGGSIIGSSSDRLAGPVTLNAQDTNSILAIGGAISFAKKVSVGAGVALNEITGNTEASVDSSEIYTDDDLLLNATTDQTIQSVSAALAGSRGTMAASAAISINDIENHTDAHISDTLGIGTQVSAGGDVEITALDASEIQSITGQVAVSTGGVAFGAAWSQNHIDNEITSYTDKADVTAGGSIDVSSTSDAYIGAIAAAGQGAKTVAVGASVGINTIGTEVVSKVSGGSLAAGEDVTVLAKDTSEIDSLTGEVALARTAAFGAAVSVNNIGTVVSASIEGQANVSADGLINVTGTEEASINALALGIAGAKTAAGVGSVGTNNIGTSVRSGVSDSILSSQGDILIEATDDSEINSLTGAAAIAGTAAVGAAVSLNDIDSTLEAYSDQASLTSTTGRIDVSSASKATIQALAVGAAVAQTVGIGGSVSTNDIGSEVRSRVSGGTLSAADGIAIKALVKEESEIESLTGAAAVAGTAAVGGAVSLNAIHNRVEAYSEQASLSSDEGEIDVTSTSNATISAAALSVAASKTAAIEGSVATNSIGTAVKAGVSGGTVEAETDILISAKDKSTIESLTGGAALSGTVAVGGAVSLNDIDNTVEAYSDGATMTSRAGRIDLSSDSDPTINALAAGAVLSGTASVNGSVATNDIGTEVRSRVNGGSLSGAEGVSIKADDLSKIRSLTGSVEGSGTGSVGAAVSLNDIHNTVEAYSENATLKSSSLGVEVSSQSDATIDAIAAAASLAGVAAVQGSVATNSIGTSVKAGVSGGTVEAETDILISAKDTSTINSLTGGADGAGTAAVGGAVSLNDIDNTVEAYSDGATMTSRAGRIDLSSDSDPTINALAVGAALSGVASVNGSVATNEIGTEVRSRVNGGSLSGAEGVSIKADDLSKIRSLTGSVAGSGTGSVGAAVSLNDIHNTVEAYSEDATLKSSGLGVEVSSKSEATIDAIAAAASLAGVAAVQGSVATNSIGTAVKAGVSGGTVEAEKDILISAKDTSTINSLTGGADGAGVAAVGGAVSLNEMDNTVEAYSDGATMTSRAGRIDLSSDSDPTIRALAVGAALSGVASVNGSVATNDIGTLVRSRVSGGSLSGANGVAIKADDYSKIESLTGTAAGAGTGSVGAAVSLNDIHNTVEAYSENATLNSSGLGVEISSQSEATIDAKAAAVSLAGVAALEGSVATNSIGTAVKAGVSGGTVDAENDIFILAKDKSTINSWTGGVAGSGTAAVGGAVSLNDIDNTVEAYSDGATVESTSGKIDVRSDSIETILAKALGVGLSGVVGLSGSVATNEVGTETLAGVRGGSLEADKDIAISANNLSTIESLTGTAAASGVAAVGAAVSLNDIDNVTWAYSNGATLTSSTGSIGVTGDSEETINSKALGAALSGTGSLSGSVSTNDIATITMAGVIGGSLTAGRDIDISATDSAKINSLAGSAVVSGVAGLGAAVSLSDIDSQVGAYSEDATLNSGGSISLVSDSDAIITTQAVNAEAGGLAVMAGSVAINDMDKYVSSHISGGNATAHEDLVVQADSKDTINTDAGVLTGSGAAGLQGSVVLNTLNNDTLAYIDQGAKVRADGYGDGMDKDMYIFDDFGNRTLQTVHGIAVTASSEETMTNRTASGGLSGGLAGGATVAVNLLQDQTKAYIQDATINQDTGTADVDQDVVVNASTKANVSSGVGNFTAAAGGGLGGAVDVTIMENQTRARIENSSVNAFKNAVIQASSDETLTSTVMGGSAGLVGGVAGSVSVGRLSGVTEALVSNSQVNAGQDLLVTARDDAEIDMLVGGLGIAGVAAAGAAVAVGDIGNITTAKVTDSTTNAKRDTSVSATSTEDITSEAYSGGLAAGVTLSGAVNVHSIHATTTAVLGGQVNQNSAYDGSEQTVRVKAQDTASINSQALAGSVGIVGAGSGVDVLSIANRTEARVDSNSKIDAEKDLVVSATSSRSAYSQVVSGSVAGVGFGGSVSSVSIDSPMGDVADAMNDAADMSIGSKFLALVSQVNSQLTAPVRVDMAGNYPDLAGTTTAIENDIQAERSSMSVTGLFDRYASMSGKGTYASIGSGSIVKTGGTVDVLAESSYRAESNVGAVSAGLASFGVSVGVTSIGTVTKALVGANSQIEAGGDLTVSAGTGRSAGSNTASIDVDAGGGGVYSSSGAVARLNVRGETTAAVEGGGSDTSLEGENVTIDADSVHHLATYADSHSGGAWVKGYVEAQSILNNQTTASVGSNVAVDAREKIEVIAESDLTAYSDAFGGSLGLVSSPGTKAETVVMNQTKSTVGQNARLNASLTKDPSVDILIKADSHIDASSRADIWGAGVSVNALVEAVSRVDSKTLVDMYGSATADRVRLESQVSGLKVKAESGSDTYAADLDSHAKSTTTVNSLSQVTVYSGATLDGKSKLEISATHQDGACSVDSIARATITGGWGDVVAEANVNINQILSRVQTKTGSTLRSNDLYIESITPRISVNQVMDAANETMVYIVYRYVEQISWDWLPWPLDWICEKIVSWVLEAFEEVRGSEGNIGTRTVNTSNDMILDGNMILTRPSSSITIQENGAFTPDGSFQVTQYSNEYFDVALSTVAQSIPKIGIFCPGGQITGGATLLQDNSSQLVEITNRSDLDLHVGDITFGVVSGSSGALSTSYTSSNGWRPIRGTATPGGDLIVSITNTGNSDVVFTGIIDTQKGTLDVNNVLGSIFGDGTENLMSGKFLLSAGGAIGTDASPLHITMVHDQGKTSTLTASADNSLDLDIDFMEICVAPPDSDDTVDGSTYICQLDAPDVSVDMADYAIWQYTVYNAAKNRKITIDKEVKLIPEPVVTAP